MVRSRDTNISIYALLVKTLFVKSLLLSSNSLIINHAQDESALHVAAQRGFASVVTAIALFQPSAVTLSTSTATPLHRCAAHGQVCHFINFSFAIFFLSREFAFTYDHLSPLLAYSSVNT